MLHFPNLERHGIEACLTEKSDGDASREGCAAIFRNHDSLTLLQQVHGTKVVAASRSTDGCEADAIIVTGGSSPGVIRVADCVPVWLFDPEIRAGAVIHAGREGTRRGIATATARQLISDYEASADRLLAVIGPSAGPCCYEVSAEMADAFEREGGIREGRMLDLWSTNRNQLISAGVRAENTETTDLCTICCGRFHSYRGDATSARNAAFLHIPAN